MEARADLITEGLGRLKVSPAIREGLKDFVSHVVDLYKGALVSVTAFGSAVTGDYDEELSDVNLLVVYSDLEIDDLQRVAELSRHWLRAQKFAPRFISRRNLDESAPYYQVDFLTMRDAHSVLWGEDVLARIEMRKPELRWQIAYQVKGMRMRLKQQFWRTAGDPRRMGAVLVERFTSLTHLMRALLLLSDLPAPLTRRETVEAAAEHFGLDRAFAEKMLSLRRSQSPPPQEALIEMFKGLMEMIRTLDARVEEVQG
jgi:predicted nucleotidyltransferase